MRALQQMTILPFPISVPTLAMMRATRHPTPLGFPVTAPLHQQQCKIPLQVLLQQVSVTTMMCHLMTRALLVVPTFPCSGRRNMVFACLARSMGPTRVVTCLAGTHVCLTQHRLLIALAMVLLVSKESMAMYWLFSRLEEMTSGRPMSLVALSALSSLILWRRLLRLVF